MHLRSAIGVLLSAVLLLPTLPVSAAIFADTAGTPYHTAFDYLSNAQIISGYPDGSGKPYATLNRAEALKVVMRMRSEDRALTDRLRAALPPLPLFSDVDQRSWYANYVEAAFERQIITGYIDGSFKPGRSVTIEEAIALLLRTYGDQGTSGAATLSPYIENRDGQWFTPYVNAVVAKNLVMHQGKLVLGAPITRGQFFDIAYRLHVIAAQKQTAYTGAEPQAGVVVRSIELVQRSPGATISVEQPRGTVSGPVSPYASQKYFAITVPDIGITDLAVIHPSDPFSSQGVLAPLQNGVGHLFSFPGGGGKVLIYGHSSGYPWDRSQYTKIFRKINELDPGDRVYVTYEGKMHVYEVTYEESVSASDMGKLNDDGRGEELVLYTCWPPDSIAQRYLVHAVPVETVALR
jgi:LPXTG-site transpeptidase (sortase) family protein